MRVMGVSALCGTTVVWVSASDRPRQAAGTDQRPACLGARGAPLRRRRRQRMADEGQYMERWQLALVLSGASIVLVGIGISLQATHTTHSQPTPHDC